MKLPIKKEYFDLIKSGKKEYEIRDAHITFICEETGEKLLKEVVFCRVRKNSDKIIGIVEDDYVMEFVFK